MPLLTNISSLARCLATGSDSVQAIPEAALAFDGGRIAWVGPAAEVPADFIGWPVEDAGGRLVIPGLIDCHTHLAFGGWRAGEFVQRIGGAGYADIHRRGGGILSTVAQTRSMSAEVLAARCLAFLGEMAALGVTTVECKSGYGLDEASELRQLEVYAWLRSRAPQRLVSTLLAAHTVPPEYADRREDYLRLVIERIIPKVAERGLARFCDAFVEHGAFSVEEARRVLVAGKEHGLRPKLHADQLSACGGAELAAEVGAVSADHLEHATDDGIAALAARGVVAVSLPVATLYLGGPPVRARALLEAGVPVAVATDFNPGSAPSYHLPFAMLLACTLQRMTPAETLRGATIVAARALGLDGECGSLEPGKTADFAIIDAPDVDHWLYHFRANACVRTVARGHTTWEVRA